MFVQQFDTELSGKQLSMDNCQSLCADMLSQAVYAVFSIEFVPCGLVVFVFVQQFDTELSGRQLSMDNCQSLCADMLSQAVYAVFSIQFVPCGPVVFVFVQQFDTELSGKQLFMDNCQSLCADMLSRAHPDARGTLRHWQTTVRSRWDDVRNVAEQKRKKLRDSLDAARATARQLDSLVDWLKHMDAFLSTQNSQLIPENLPIVEQLLQTHVVRAPFLTFRLVSVNMSSVT